MFACVDPLKVKLLLPANVTLLLNCMAPTLPPGFVTAGIIVLPVTEAGVTLAAAVVISANGTLFMDVTLVPIPAPGVTGGGALLRSLAGTAVGVVTGTPGSCAGRTAVGAKLSTNGVGASGGTGIGAGDDVVIVCFNKNIYDRISAAHSPFKTSAIEKYLWQKHSIMYPHILIFL